MTHHNGNWMNDDQRSAVEAEAARIESTEAGGQGDAMRTIIASSIKGLCESQRGRAVVRDLLALLDGPASQLDLFNWKYVDYLLTIYRNGYPASVLSALRTATK